MSREDDIKQLILEHHRRLQILKEKAAKFGLNTPPEVLTEIEDIKAELAALQAELDGLDQAPRFNPYRGLSAFREEDAPFFFGRETFTTQLVESVQQKPLVAVLGPSGSGKSSIVFAGLLPRLRREGSWLIATFRPGSDPFKALAAILLPLYETGLDQTDQMVQIPKLATYLRQGDLPLTDVITKILQLPASPPHTSSPLRLLLIADQFEELYTLCPDLETRQRFVDTLLQAIPSAPLHLVLTLRADFLGQVLAYRPLADALREADVKLGPMNGEELRRAIEQPAEAQSVSFEAGLVERILEDVSDEPGNLPLLEFALTALWEHQSTQPSTIGGQPSAVGGRLTHSAYEAVGRVEGALSRHAEQVFTGLSEAEQECARQVFVQLIRPGEGTEDTRRLAAKAELDEAGWILAQQLANERLVVTDQDAEGQETVEVVHEALIRNWDRLRGWMDADRAFRAWQERLRADLRQWEASHGDEGALLRGAPLAEAKGWLAERERQLSQTEREFIQDSLTLRERERQARERRRNLTIGVALTVAVVMAVLGAFGLNRSQEAQKQAATAEAERATAQRQSRISLAQSLAALAPRTNDNELTVLLAIEAFHLNRQVRGDAVWLIDSALRELLSTPYFSNILRGHEAGVNSVAFSPDGQTLASNGVVDQIRLWDLSNPQAQPQVLRGHESLINSVAFSPDGQTLASTSDDRTIRLWDLSNLQTQPQVLRGHEEEVVSVAFSPDGKTLASASDDQTIRLWDLYQPDAEPRVLRGHEAGVNSVAFSPDGKTLASASLNQTIRLWDLSNLQTQPQVLYGHEAGVNSVAFSPDGQTLASASLDQTIRLWDLSNLQTQPQVLYGHEAGVNSVAFSPDGQTLASASLDQTIRLWDLSNLQAQPQVLRGHETLINSVAFSPDGQTLASASDDRTIRLWDLSNLQTQPQVLRGHEQEVFSIAFSPDGKTLASASADQTIRLWDLSNLQTQPQVLRDHNAWVNSVAFSPDGQTLASAVGDRTIRLWDLSNLQAQPQVLRGHELWVNSVAFSPDGQTLASASADRTIRLWDLSNLQAQPQVLPGHEDWVNSVAFSPDGQTLASASADRTIRLWDLSNPQAQPQVLRDHEAWVNSVAFSPDGQTLASASDDQTIRLWDLSKPQAQPQVLRGHEEEVVSVAFSPDGQTLASTSNDQTIRLWDLRQPDAEPRVLRGHEFEVNSVAFSPDGKTLASANGDRTVRLWIAQLETLVELGCQKVRHNLSQAEWDRYLPGETYHRTCANLPSGQGSPADAPAAIK